mmetsp:Transcript_36147/g.93279  ORF Transcript_36147/g.93279 Transcript_36147/m.93279 type:complete len:218 (+) Transcript_36147:128-781(+)
MRLFGSGSPSAAFVGTPSSSNLEYRSVCDRNIFLGSSFFLDSFSASCLACSSLRLRPAASFDSSFFSPLSLSPMMRLKVGLPAGLYLSTTKKPLRSNWKRSYGFVFASDASSLASVSSTREFGLTDFRKSSLTSSSAPSSTASSASAVTAASCAACLSRVSYRRTGWPAACLAETQWMTPLTLRSVGMTSRVVGSWVQRSSVTFPLLSLMISFTLMT